MANDKDLPGELRSLVKLAVAVLGDIIRLEQGDANFRRIEAIRKSMTTSRSQSLGRVHGLLKHHLKEMRTFSKKQQHDIAHSFTLMLELINACENAYRTYRLRNKDGLPSTRNNPHTTASNRIIYVLTAHPTEARSPENIFIFHEIEKTLVEILNTSFSKQESNLRHFLEIAMRLPIARKRKPRVEDEAEHIYSILLRDETLTALLESNRDICPVYIQTWVGGDKDGHPGVDENVMLHSLEMSRGLLLKFIRYRLQAVRKTIDLIGNSPDLKKLKQSLGSLERQTTALKTIRPSDGNKVSGLHRQLADAINQYVKCIGEPHPSLLELVQLLKLFPGLVVALELRESSDVLRTAKDSPSTHAIGRMLATLNCISQGGDPQWYARSLIISMANQMVHIEWAMALMNSQLKALKIPIIPLFEDKSALDRATEIVEAMIQNQELKKARQRYWSDYFEVMLGYSDSAKEMGALPSRLAIAQGIYDLDRLFRKHKITPVYFHGSGGSIDRGGGSIAEQTSWWPRNALNVYKATLQGEMIERSFSSPEIAMSRLQQILERTKEKPVPLEKNAAYQETLCSFAEFVRREYQKKITSPDFYTIVNQATAYRFLSVLRLGSRPAKRSGPLQDISALRAIPWVLSWTQTRILFPVWWGVGAAWASMSRDKKQMLRQAFEQDPLFRSYIKTLGFTLAKVEMAVWHIYLEESTLPQNVIAQTKIEFELEFKQAISLVKYLSGSRDLLWFRPWLGTSIIMRSPMIHPLNLLQIIALENNDNDLIRETVTGISSGMLTTG